MGIAMLADARHALAGNGVAGFTKWACGAALLGLNVSIRKPRVRSTVVRSQSRQNASDTLANKTRGQIDAAFHGIMARSFGAVAVAA